MNDGLYVPPGARAVLVDRIPDGDVRLADGRRLVRQAGRPLAGGGIVAAGAWEGPDRLTVLASLDESEHGRLLHVSLSYPRRDPDWRTIKLVRDAFYPDTVDVAMILPRAEDYVNVHPHCFQMVQIPVVWGIR